MCLYALRHICFITGDHIAFHLRIHSRIKSQYESELREMERVERQTRDKYTETRSKLAELDGDIQNLNATVKQYEIQLSHSQKVKSLRLR